MNVKSLMFANSDILICLFHVIIFRLLFFFVFLSPYIRCCLILRDHSVHAVCTISLQVFRYQYRSLMIELNFNGIQQFVLICGSLKPEGLVITEMHWHYQVIPGYVALRNSCT